MEIWKIIVAFVSPFPGQRSLEKCFVFIYIYILKTVKIQNTIITPLNW